MEKYLGYYNGISETLTDLLFGQGFICEIGISMVLQYVEKCGKIKISNLEKED